MRHAAETLDELGVPYEKEVVSAHRTPDKLFAYAEAAEARGLQVIIAGAGGAAHLPGMTSSKTLLPVLGVPVESKALQGLTRSSPSRRCRRGPRGNARDRRPGRSMRHCSRLQSWRAETRACGSGLPRTARVRPSPCSPRPIRGVKYSLGCIGGGQLGRMLALAGAPLDVRFRFLDPAPDACAGDVGELVVGPYADEVLLDRLAEGTDAVTYEFENVPVEAARRVRAIPDARALERGQDRLVEKELFAASACTARYGSLAESGLPALVKSRRLGYDGKGQRVVESVVSLGTTSWRRSSSRSIASCRSSLCADDGETVFYPLAENEHRGGSSRSRALLRETLCRAQPRRSRRSSSMSSATSVCWPSSCSRSMKLLANEFAPRVHNTGHWTIDGAVTSQFENHGRFSASRSATDALGESVMVNLVGEALPLERLLRIPGAHVHLYGKASRAGRKLGHVTLVDADEGRVAEVVGLAAAAWA